MFLLGKTQKKHLGVPDLPLLPQLQFKHSCTLQIKLRNYQTAPGNTTADNI